MQEYVSFELDSLPDKEVLLITSLEDVYYLYSEIYDNLSKKYGSSFSILIDLFLRNGFSFNRFAKIIFTDRNKYKIILVNQRDVSEEVKANIRKYLKSNIKVLERSTLSSNAIDFIKNF